MAMTAAEREAAHRTANDLQQRLRRLTALHRRDWPAPRPSTAPPRRSPDAPPHPAEPARPAPEQLAAPLLAGIPRWRLGERRVARRLAVEQAEATYQRALERHRARLAVHRQRLDAHARALARLEQERAAEQRLLGHVHERLLAGDRAASERAVATALGELPSPARVVGWHGEAVVLAVTAPEPDAVPEREPDWTAGGKPTTRKLSQTERNEQRAELVAAITVAAARRALAAAPGVPLAVAAAVDNGEVLAHCRVDRAAAKPASDALVALYDLDGNLEQTGRTSTLAPLDVSALDELRALAGAHSHRS
jgi:hypothetical protein